VQFILLKKLVLEKNNVYTVQESDGEVDTYVPQAHRMNQFMLVILNTATTTLIRTTTSTAAADPRGAGGSGPLIA
jgi:hypothetical protein